VQTNLLLFLADFLQQKYHHQNPRADFFSRYPELAGELKVTATSHSGRIVEAVERENFPALGIQFHPEKSLPYVKHQVFKWFLNEACEYQQSQRGE
jgi:gamma-glutamyl-gamma-aminobutyrate hydrolase PuuD